MKLLALLAFALAADAQAIFVKVGYSLYLPGECNATNGIIYFTTLGGIVGPYWCDVPNTWVLHAADSAAVTSVFGRTGVVAADAGDYVWNQIGGSLAGDVSNVGATLTVVGLQGRAVSPSAPTNQQVLPWSTSLQEYVPATITGAGGVSSVAGTSGQFACSPATGNVICGYTAPTAIPGNATVAGSLAIGALGTAGTNHYYDTSGTDTTLGSPSTATGSVLIGGVNAAIGTGSTGHGTCWKSAIRIGYCSTAVDSSGNCTCN
jgi:hypothetical protein